MAKKKLQKIFTRALESKDVSTQTSKQTPVITKSKPSLKVDLEGMPRMVFDDEDIEKCMLSAEDSMEELIQGSIKKAQFYEWLSTLKNPKNGGGCC